MEDYNNKTINEDYSTDRGTEIYKNKKYDKKRKIKANEIPLPIKDFYSDDEDNDAFKIKFNKYNNQRNIQIKTTRKHSQNSILIYKQQLQKKSTIAQTPNKKGEREINILEINSKIKDKNKKTKKVNFPKENFLKIIEIESYKKYNCDHSNIEPYSEDKIKADSKCCLIF